MNGKVYLVGAGPGDPELLTLRALRLLQNADAVVYDRLVGKAILDCINPRAITHDVGKIAGCSSHMQDVIHGMLRSLAATHPCVVRLKGGDPFIFGRGGEELLYLNHHNIRTEVVPGITAATGCAASLGIPLTHRGLATSVRFVTGHLRDNHGLQLDWRSLVDPSCTLVFYMAIANSAHIASSLIDHGRPACTPAALVQDATLSRQRWVLTTLEQIPAAIGQFHPPALLIIGDVVRLHPDYTSAGQPSRHARSMSQPCPQA